MIQKLNEKCNYLQKQFKIETTEHNELKDRFNEYEMEYNSLSKIHSELDEKYNITEHENSKSMQKIDELNDEIIELKNALSSNQKIRFNNGIIRENRKCITSL